MAKRKSTKEQTRIYKTLHRKLKVFVKLMNVYCLHGMNAIDKKT
jgi:hypothetical protein